MIPEIEQHRQYFERIHHGGKDGPEAALAIQSLQYPGFGPVCGVCAESFGNQRIEAAAATVEKEKRPGQQAGTAGLQWKIMALLFGGILNNSRMSINR